MIKTPFKIIADASLPHLSNYFNKPFIISTYNSQEELKDKLNGQDILLCRSTLKVNKELLHKNSVRCVATASSGIDHLDINYLKQNNITVFDAKGCNAQSVADYVLTSIAWLQESKLLQGSKAGIIGMGCVGTAVAHELRILGFDLLYYDPLRAEIYNNETYCTLEELNTCDLLCIHANLHKFVPHPSYNLINANLLKKLKPNVVIINAARGGIVNESDLLSIKNPITYCTDVYENEPTINPRIIEFASLCTPHIAGHSIEAKTNAISLLSQQLYSYYGIHLIVSTDDSEPRPSGSENPLANARGADGPVDTMTAASTNNWQKAILKLYNPFIETTSLKLANNKTQAFLTIRKEHNNRHDFILRDL